LLSLEQPCKKCFDQVLELTLHRETTRQEIQDGLYAPRTSTTQASVEDALGLGTGFFYHTWGWKARSKWLIAEMTDYRTFKRSRIVVRDTNWSNGKDARCEDLSTLFEKRREAMRRAFLHKKVCFEEGRAASPLLRGRNPV
jgi:hypothetical protein